MAGVALSDSYLLLWDASNMDVFSLQSIEASLQCTIPYTSSLQGVCLHGDMIYRSSENRLEGLSASGVLKECIEFPSSEGNPHFLTVHGNYMAVLTDTLYLHLYSMKGRKPKKICSTKVC